MNKYIKIPNNTCYWESQGNGYHKTMCGHIIKMPNYKTKGITHCPICRYPIYEDKSDPIIKIPISRQIKVKINKPGKNNQKELKA